MVVRSFAATNHTLKRRMSMVILLGRLNLSVTGGVSANVYSFDFDCCVLISHIIPFFSLQCSYPNSMSLMGMVRRSIVFVQIRVSVVAVSCVAVVVREVGGNVVASLISSVTHTQ